MRIDPLLSGEDNFLALMNATNGKSFASSEFVFGPPGTFGPEEGNANNTAVMMMANSNSKVVKGDRMFTYSRLDLAVVASNLPEPEPYQVVEGDDPSVLAAHYAAVYGLRAQDVTVEPTGEEAGPDNLLPLFLKAVGGSYLYIGQMTIYVKVEPQLTDLSSAYSTTELDGFLYQPLQ